ASQFAEKFVVAENRRRCVLLDGAGPWVAWGCQLRAGRFGLIEVNGGVVQAAETEILRRVGRDNCSAAVTSAGAIHGIGSVRAHSTGYYRKGRCKGTGKLGKSESRKPNFETLNDWPT